jgi:hypothetical protein
MSDLFPKYHSIEKKEKKELLSFKYSNLKKIQNLI